MLRGLVSPKGVLRVPTGPDSNSMSPSEITILLADDHKGWRRQVRYLLAQHPKLQIVSEASDGLDAVQRASEFQPDVVLLDIQMPRVNGIEAAQAIRKAHPDTIIIFVTQNGDVDVMNAALAYAERYILKTHAPSELIAAINNALDSAVSHKQIGTAITAGDV